LNFSRLSSKRIGFGFVALSAVFLAAFRLGNHFGFEVPLVVRGSYLVCAVAFGVLHGIQTRGGGNALRFALAIAGVSYAAELIGVQTGWLFGSYTYGVILGPHLPGGVPVGIPVFWVLLLYAADDLVNICLGVRTPRLFRALTVGAVTAAWDIMIDPIAVAYGGWSWGANTPEGLLLFGIPLTNALGWWLVGTAAIWATGVRSAHGPGGMPLWYEHLPALAMGGAVLNNIAATSELGFPAAGLVGAAALAPYFVVAMSRWKQPTRTM
jgi:uncharacterized membrane protein